MFLALVAATLFACSSSDTSSDTTDTGGGYPCQGFGCERGAGPLVIKVVDASGAEIASPTFTREGVSVVPECESTTDTGAGSCPSGWTFRFLFEGPNSVVVSAPGFGTQTVTATLEGPSGCCGVGPEVDRTVTLIPIHTSDSGFDASEGG
jgi:hypothetical protein